MTGRSIHSSQLSLLSCITYVLSFFFKWYGDHRDLHYPLRRQRQMCIRDRYMGSQGEMTFSMMASGEAGLDEGKPFNIRFLIKSDAATRRRLLEETHGDASANLPSAQINDAATMIVKKNNNAFKLGYSLLLLAFLFLML
eukprot:TRINITY_DN5664_c0_g1_i3.p1 TRINITY_DN5664_c0_g1~~TRINITY_DN5664_c0_g1_i3.p1  ORF type:complete len:140 (-),score=21.47 TRINITY_DN5664_c0_g1_i3:76-495(-)